MLSFLAGVMPAIYVAMQGAGAPAGGAAPAAAATPAQTAQSPFGGPWYMPILLVVGVFYLLVWRPQMKQRRTEDDWRKNIKRGDEVVTSGGLLGKVSGIADNVITLELQEKVRVKVLRSHVVGKPPGAGDPQPQPAKTQTE